MYLSSAAKADLQWWQTNLDTMCAPIHWPPITNEIATDASSLLAWGASFAGLATGGAWADSESDIHMNVKEMIAIHYALRSFLPYLKGSHVRVLCDNTTAVSVLNKMGSTRSIECNNMARDLAFL
jgi:hypothetical protein